MCLAIYIEFEKINPDEIDKLHQSGLEKCGLFFEFREMDQKVQATRLRLRTIGEGCGCEMGSNGIGPRDELWKFHTDYIPKIEESVRLLLQGSRNRLIFDPYWLGWYDYEIEDDIDEDEELPDVSIELEPFLEKLRTGTLKKGRLYAVWKESEKGRTVLNS